MTVDGTRPSLREQQKQQTRSLLLAAATEVIALKGFAAASIDDITDAAGTSRATFYAHFKSKDAVLQEIVTQMWAEAEQHYRAFGDLPDWSRRRVRGWVRSFAAAWEHDAARNTAFAEAAVTVGMMSDIGVRYAALVRVTMTNAALWTRFASKADAGRRATMLVHMIEGYLDEHFRDRGARATDAVVDSLTDAVRDLLRADD